jgi:hypothetical protein
MALCASPQSVPVPLDGRVLYVINNFRTVAQTYVKTVEPALTMGPLVFDATVQLDLLEMHVNTEAY